MSNHIITYLENKGEHYARCKCGRLTDKHPSLQGVEDDVRKHHEYVERVRAHLSTKTPSLKQQRDHFLDMALHDTNPQWRPIWKQLADELSVRLGDKAPTWEQPELMEF